MDRQNAPIAIVCDSNVIDGHLVRCREDLVCSRRRVDHDSPTIFISLFASKQQRISASVICVLGSPMASTALLFLMAMAIQGGGTAWCFG